MDAADGSGNDRLQRSKAPKVVFPDLPTVQGFEMPWRKYAKWDDLVRLMRTELTSAQEQTRRDRDDFKDPGVFSGVIEARIRPQLVHLDIPDTLVNEVKRDLYYELMGYGALQLYMESEGVEDILLDRWDTLDIIQRGQKFRVKDTPFRSESEVFQWLQTAVFSPLNKDFNRSNPLENAVLNDGSRMFAFTDPVSPFTGFALRKHRAEVFANREDYERSGVATAELFAELDGWVKSRYNMVFAGSTGSGKTTLTNYAAALVPYEQRMLTLEDTPELQIHHPRVKPFYTYESGARAGQEKQSDISMRSLLKAALRMKPDRIIIGECRDAETFDMLDTLNTGHAGSFTTLHSNSPVDAITRLQTMAIRASVDFPIDSLRDLIAAVIDIVVQIKYFEETHERKIYAVEQVMYRPHYHEQQEIFEAGRPLYPNLSMRPLYRYSHEHGRLMRVADFAPPDHMAWDKQRTASS